MTRRGCAVLLIIIIAVVIARAAATVTRIERGNERAREELQRMSAQPAPGGHYRWYKTSDGNTVCVYTTQTTGTIVSDQWCQQ